MAELFPGGKMKTLFLLVLFFAIDSKAQIHGSHPAGSSLKPTETPKSKIYEKPNSSKIKSMLSAEEFSVTQNNGTERPFSNRYWDNHAAGIYVDIVTGEPLFASLDKFDSGTGWPSFTKPIFEDQIKKKTDQQPMLGTRTEVRSKIGDSHLGHVFDDGPPERGGLRYCINSASLRFIPESKLKESGYEEFLRLFSNKK